MAISKENEYFLKALKVAITNSTIYFREHPLFLSTIDDLKNKIDLVCSQTQTIKLSFSKDYLVLNGEKLEIIQLYVDLADFFHRRYVKTLFIEKDVSKSELVNFLGQSTLSVSDIVKRGGLTLLLKQSGVLNISTQSLDYTSLIYGQGQVIKDVWSYLLAEAVDSGDSEKASIIVDNFSKMCKTVASGDLVKDDSVRNNVVRFLGYLKKNNNQGYKNCSKVLTSNILNAEGSINPDDNAKLRVFFEDLDSSEAADLLWEKISKSKNFNAERFKTFTQLVPENKHKEIALNLAAVLKGKNDDGLREKLRDIFSSSIGSGVSDIYSGILLSSFEQISPKGILKFDRVSLAKNYRYIIINLLIAKTDLVTAKLALQKLNDQWPSIIRDLDIEFINSFLEVLAEELINYPSLETDYLKILNNITSFVEDKVFSDSVDFDFWAIYDNLHLTTKNLNQYLVEIFEKANITPFILTLYFKFFPENFSDFCKMLTKRLILTKKHSDSGGRFLSAMIEAIVLTRCEIKFELLKVLYALSDDEFKLKIIKIMRDIPLDDKSFILSLLKSPNSLIRKEALKVLLKYQSMLSQAGCVLFSGFNFLGFNNTFLINNITIAEELDFKGSLNYLKILADKDWLWNKPVAAKASITLKRWTDDNG
ncbi:MAG: hypothetical protein PHV17_03600 [Candidatus Omnitrophica bacterium]|nr:hypothetical protein [Candidatus Omnitrophota bacterium]